jgi:hypothetical protein
MNPTLVLTTDNTPPRKHIFRGIDLSGSGNAKPPLAPGGFGAGGGFARI